MSLAMLHRLYGKIAIPEAVWKEVTEQGQNQPGSKEVEETNWIDVQRVVDQDLIRSFQRDLDIGESEAIALSTQIGADLLLMDERLGREIAALFNLRVVGVIGILMEAKHKGLIREIKPSLDQLRMLAGFYINPALYERIVREEGEV